MASAMRPAPTKPTRLQPDSSAAAAITPLRRAPPHPRTQRRQWTARASLALVHWLRRPHAPPSPGVSVREAGRREGRGGGRRAKLLIHRSAAVPGCSTGV